MNLELSAATPVLRILAAELKSRVPAPVFVIFLLSLRIVRLAPSVAVAPVATEMVGPVPFSVNVLPVALPVTL